METILRKIIFPLGLLLSVPIFGAAQTAEPFVLLTWQADSYAPPGFQGKVLPTAYTKISAGVEVISGGRSLNLSEANINWYWNNQPIAGGQDKRRAEFYPEFISSLNDLRVEISGIDKGLLIKTVEIPVVQPQVVIEAPFPGGVFFENQITLTARPYFWNPNSISDLIFDWQVNNQTPEKQDNVGVLQINMQPGVAPGFEIKVSLRVYNPTTAAEATAKTLFLTFAP